MPHSPGFEPNCSKNPGLSFGLGRGVGLDDAENSLGVGAIRLLLVSPTQILDTAFRLNRFVEHRDHVDDSKPPFVVVPDAPGISFLKYPSLCQMRRVFRS